MKNCVRTIKQVGVVAALGLVALISATPAQAVDTVRNWASASSPWVVTVDGVAQGAAYGDWRLTYQSSELRSYARGYVKDYRAGGASIYFELRTQTNAGHCIAPAWTSCSQPWNGFADDDSAHSNSDLWVSTSASTSVHSNADYARGLLRTCEEVNWVPDDCTGWYYTQGDSYH